MFEDKFAMVGALTLDWPALWFYDVALWRDHIAEFKFEQILRLDVSTNEGPLQTLDKPETHCLGHDRDLGLHNHANCSLGFRTIHLPF